MNIQQSPLQLLNEINIISKISNLISKEGFYFSPLFIINLMLFIAVTFGLLSRNNAFLLYGLDGSYFLQMVKEQYSLPFHLGFTNNFLQSLGNIYFPINTLLVPGYLLPAILGNGIVNKIFCYLIFTTEIYLTIFIISKILKFPTRCTYLASWMFVLLAFPFNGIPLLYEVLSLVPHLITSMCLFLASIVFLTHLENFKSINYSISLVAIILILIYCTVTFPAAATFIAPLLAIYGCTMLVLAKSQSMRLKLIAGFFVILGSFIGSGCLHFIMGTFQYSAAEFFKHDFFNFRLGFFNVSILYHNNILSMVLVISGILGAILDIRKSTPERKKFAIGFLVSLISINIYGFIIQFFPGWHRPPAIYYELYLWPLYSIYSMLLLTEFSKYIMSLFHTRYHSISHYSAASSKALAWFISPLLPVLMASCFLWHKIPQSYNCGLYPPMETSLIKLLQTMIGFDNSSLFRGRLGTFTSLTPEQTSWSSVHSEDIMKYHKYGSDYRLISMPYYNIPSLFEYSPLITPAFYLTAKHFLAKKQDEQIRNILLLRNINEKILSLWGIRFIISDHNIANLGQKIPLNEEKNFYLYELVNFNKGQYSPVKTLTVADAKTALSVLGDSAFDPTTTLITNHSIEPKEYVPATKTTMKIIQGNLHLQSHSKGDSLLVLPVEYSHCFEIIEIKSGEKINLFRANIVQMGISFRGDLDIILKYFTSPFHNEKCRLLDKQEMEKWIGT